MPRQLIVCCDGTNNNLTAGREDTNVVKFLRWVGAPGSGQHVFYDPGVGNPGALPGATLWDRYRRLGERIAGLAFGRGVYENVAEAYQFLMQSHQPGDELYFFGFSRGAFTARSAAGLVNMFGILRPHMQSMVPTLLHIYFSHRRGTAEAEAQERAGQIRESFCDPEKRAVPIHFVGVWDTVASVGMWPVDAKMTARPGIGGKRFVHVRQALALDEHRGPFKPRLYLDRAEDADPHQSVVQRWFRGAHCDVGGGYPPARSVISNEALAWMLAEAASVGLRLDESRVPRLEQDAIRDALDPGLVGRPPIIHSETYDNCLWAVAGLAIRRPRVVEIDGEGEVRVEAVEHPSAKASLAFPQGSVWARPRPAKEKVELAALALLATLLYFGMGSLLVPADSGSVAAWLAGIPAYLDANTRFVQWQLLAWAGLPAPAFASPAWAIVADLFLVPCYATLLAWWVSWAFARVAGFTRAHDAPRPFACLLGRALPCLVVSDVLENALTLLLLWLAPVAEGRLLSSVGALVAAAAAAKLAALAGVAWLLAWGLIARARKDAAPMEDREWAPRT